MWIVECGLTKRFDCPRSAIRNPQSTIRGLRMSIVYRGRVFSVEVDQRRHPNGSIHEVAIVRHPRSVVLIPFELDGRVVLVKQYRAPLDRETWEVPAGSLEPGETAEDAARR